MSCSAIANAGAGRSRTSATRVASSSVSGWARPADGSSMRSTVGAWAAAHASSTTRGGAGGGCGARTPADGGGAGGELGDELFDDRPEMEELDDLRRSRRRVDRQGDGLR